MKKQRTFTSSFKAKVALEAIKGIKTIEKTSSEYEVHPTQINKWKTQAINQQYTIFEKNDTGQIEKLKDKYESKEEKLYEQIGRQKVELDFLKKNLGD